MPHEKQTFLPSRPSPSSAKKQSKSSSPNRSSLFGRIATALRINPDPNNSSRSDTFGDEQVHIRKGGNKQKKVKKSVSR